MRGSLIKKIVSVFFGFAAAILILEVGLWIHGMKWRSDSATQSGADGPVILCLGNSFTAGVGAPRGQAYCDFLLKSIEANDLLRAEKFRVINLGVPNFNSAQVYSQLQSSMQKYHPRLVLIMAGQPNLWNRVGAPSGRFQRVYDTLYRLRSFRFFTKLFYQLTQEGKYSKLFPEVPLKNERELGLRWLGFSYHAQRLPDNDESLVDEALLYLPKLFESDPEKYFDVCRILAVFYSQYKQRPDIGFQWYAKGLTINPETFHYDFYESLKSLSWLNPSKPLWKLYQALLLEAAKNIPPQLLLQQARVFFNFEDTFVKLNNFPWPPEQATWSNAEKLKFLNAISNFRPVHVISLKHIASAYESIGEVGRAAEAYEKILDRNPYSLKFTLNELYGIRESATDPIERARIESLIKKFSKLGHQGAVNLDSRYLEKWVARDLLRMGSLLRSEGVAFIFMNYPPVNQLGTRGFPNDVIRMVTEKYKYPLFDTHGEMLTNSAFAKNKKAFFSTMLGEADDHLNGEGNRLLANLLFARLMKDGFLVGPQKQ